MQHLPTPECVRVRKIIEREQRAQKLQEKLADRDLVEMALSDPSEFTGSPLLQNALLGRAFTFPDECAVVACITGKSWHSGEGLLSSMASYDQDNEPYIPIDAWKLVYCDLYYIDGSDATLQDIYEERLREEKLQTPAAQAREIVRRDVIKLKVAYYSLKSWFYAARWEGVSVRDMWLKAQQHSDKLWICYTKCMEEWDHEPYI
ncbi:hypothetical protein LCI18_004303 [Fusarium solani-melongenae]|uniref:Uncharacterized protein n=1 Tax=Fusarium solani subsp. cucurbitae TaxID=2747967 RepID=A0ACD3YWJ8_FUSSC|nr:hypothetical protein LCI18_004303 [Fusarium solani-melongenae]